MPTRQQFCGDISTAFQSNCQARMVIEIESKYHRKIVVIVIDHILSLQDVVLRGIHIITY